MMPNNETESDLSPVAASTIVAPPAIPPLALSPVAVALKPPAPGGAAAEFVPVPEIGGPKGPEPTRFGDWERKGRCSDF